MKVKLVTIALSDVLKHVMKRTMLPLLHITLLFWTTSSFILADNPGQQKGGNCLDKTFETNTGIDNLFEGDIVHDSYVDFVYKKTVIDKSESPKDRYHDNDMRLSENEVPISDDARLSELVDLQKVEPLHNDILDNRADTSTDWASLYSECPTGKTKRNHKRAAMMGHERLWPNGIVYYEFDYSISPEKQKVIRSSMAHWESNTCIRFQPRTKETHYLSFYNGAGCFTVVGRAGGRQGVSINDACMYMGTVAHELAHALGFWHEQSRPDRDLSVDIIWENIKKGKEHNFNKMDYKTIDSRGITYDYNSIMHYGPYSFSINDSLPTIRPKNQTLGIPVTMGQRSRLSDMDIRQANRLYCCPVGACSENPCGRGRCSETRTFPFYKCTCFEGWYGVNCTENNDKCASAPCSNGVCLPDSLSFGGFKCLCNEGYQGLLCDEEYLQCPDAMFGCTKQGVCVKRSVVCDFNNNCGDWSDESVVCGTCTFEGGMCGWQNTGKWIWSVNGGSTPSENTGPDIDHTLRSVAGKYLYVEASDQLDEGETAEITSPEYRSSAPSCKMEFAYFMFGTDVGSLEVELISRSRIEKLLQVSGNQGQYWHLSQVQLGQRFRFKVRFVAVRGPGWRGDIAVDDILFTGCSTLDDVDNCKEHVCVHGQCLVDEVGYSCQCNPGYTGYFCDQDVDECLMHNCTVHGRCQDKVDGFECVCDHGFLGDYCQIQAEYTCDMEDELCIPWTNSDDEDFYWRLGQGQTPSKGTGPSVDHTFGNRTGHYLYVEGSEPHMPGDRAVLEMGPLSNSDEDCLVAFFYHMHGETMGRLSVSVKYKNGTKEEVWARDGDHGDVWLRAVINIGARSAFTIQIIAIVGAYWKSDIAIDDIMLAGGCGALHRCAECQKNGKCRTQHEEPHCQFNPGFEGEWCEKDKNECESAPCGNHGTCHNLLNGYLCTCDPGFEGKICEIKVTQNCPSLNRPCVFGKCVDGIKSFRCKCDVGYIGRYCDVASCDPNPCKHQGTCIQQSKQFQCQCAGGYSGDLCDVLEARNDTLKSKKDNLNKSIGDCNGDCVSSSTKDKTNVGCKDKRIPDTVDCRNNTFMSRDHREIVSASETAFFCSLFIILVLIVIFQL